MRVLVTSAPGAGSSTLAAALARKWGWRHLDTDDFYWTQRSGDDAYEHKCSPGDRLQRLRRAIDDSEHVVLSGSIMGWGADVECCFDLIVFIYTATAVRLQRLAAREQRELGRIDQQFLDWAASYDTGKRPGRSLDRHRQWLGSRTCPVAELRGEAAVAALVAEVEPWIINGKKMMKTVAAGAPVRYISAPR